MTGTVLLVSDKQHGLAIEQALSSVGFHVDRCEMGSAAMERALQSPPGAVLVDARSNPCQSTHLCWSLRSVDETARLPIVALVRADKSNDRLALLEAGADDCWTESAESREFILRLKGLARRIETPRPTRVLRYADIELDLDRLKVRRNGTSVQLPLIQLKLLRLLIENPTIVFSHRQLLEQVWRNPELDEGAVRACVVRLRRALNKAGGPDLIKNVPGVGYALDADA